MALSVASQVKQIEISHARYGQWSSTLEFSVFLNRAPDRPVLSAPAHEAINQTARPIFTWQVPADAENSALDFQIQIDYLESFDSQDGNALIEALSQNSYEGFSFNAAVPANSGEASYQPPLDLLNRSIYFWRVRAFDGERYGFWSEPYKFTVGVLATQVVLAADRVYQPLAGMRTTVTATYTDANGDVDVAYDGLTTFVQSQQLIGTFSPVIALPVNGVASVEYIASGRLGATRIEITSPLSHNILILYSVQPSNVPVLITPVHGSRLASESLPQFLWMVPNNSTNMHFKIEVYDAPLLNEAHLVYVKDSRVDTTGFSYTEAVPPLSPDVWHTLQSALPDGKYWWRIIPWDTTGYKEPSELFMFSMPNQMVIVSKPLLSEKPVTQAVLMANVVIEKGTENNPGEARHYVTNMALEPEDEIVWHDVTEYVANRKKFVFKNRAVPASGWAIAIKTIIDANESTGIISFNGHGVVFDGDYSETINEDYVGVISALTPISFQALPSIDGDTLTLSWAYVDLNSDNRRIIDKFILEVYNPATGLYEPYDGDKGEIIA